MEQPKNNWLKYAKRSLKRLMKKSKDYCLTTKMDFKKEGKKDFININKTSKSQSLKFPEKKTLKL
jgi:hypothetical protein